MNMIVRLHTRANIPDGRIRFTADFRVLGRLTHVILLFDCSGRRKHCFLA